MQRLVTGRGILLALPSVPPIRVLSGDVSWRARQDCGECQSPRLTNIGGASAAERTGCVIHGHGA